MATNQELLFIMRMQNEISKTLGDVKKDLGGLENKLEDVNQKGGKLTGAFRKVGGALGDVSKIAGGFLAAQAITQLPGVISGITDRAKDLELQAGKAATVFGESLGTVQEWAAESSSAMGLSRLEAQNLATSMADLLIPMGFTREEAAKMSTETLNLSGALAEWSGGQVSAAEVSDILAKAYLGETESLKSLGVSINAAEIEGRLLEKGQKDLEGAALAQAKALAIQELILEKSTDAQAAFAEGGGTAARKQAEMQAAMANAKDELSLALAPALTQVQLLLANVVIPAFTALTVWLTEELAPAIAEWWEVWGPRIKKTWEEDIKPPLVAFLEAVQETVAWVQAHWDQIWAVMGPVFDQIRLNIETTITILANLISFIVNVFKGDWDAAFKDLQDIFDAVWKHITGSLENFAALVEGIWPLAKAAMKGLGEAIMDGLKDGIKAATGFAQSIVEDIGNLLKSWINQNVINKINRGLEFTIKISNPIGKDPSITINPPDIPHLAAGTSHFAGGLALVGEHGPELAALPRGSRVLSHGQTLAAMAGGGSMVVNVNMPNYLGDREEVARIVERALSRRFA